MAEETKVNENLEPVQETEEALKEKEAKKKKAKEAAQEKDTAYDLQEEFEPKKYDFEKLMDYWKKQAGLKSVEPAVEGDALDVTFENGTSIKDKGSSMTMAGKDGKTPEPEDFDKIVKSSMERGWRAVAIGPNCSDEFKANLYLACAKNGVDCVLNGYNPPEEVKAMAKQLYAQAKGNKPEEQAKPKEQEQGGTLYNPSEAELKKQKGGESKETPVENPHKENFAKIDKVAREFTRNTKRKFNYDLGSLKNKQFKVWQAEYADLQKKIAETPDKKLTSREKKLTANAQKFGYDKPENKEMPKTAHLIAKDFDKKFAVEYANLKKNQTLNKVAIENLTSSLKLTLVDPNNPSYGKLDVDKDVNKETFRQGLIYNINSAVAAAKGTENGNVEARHIFKAIDNMKAQTKKQNKQIDAIINPKPQKKEKVAGAAAKAMLDKKRQQR